MEVSKQFYMLETGVSEHVFDLMGQVDGQAALLARAFAVGLNKGPLLQEPALRRIEACFSVDCESACLGSYMAHDMLAKAGYHQVKLGKSSKKGAPAFKLPLALLSMARLTSSSP